MRVLGIDPSYQRTGFAVVEDNKLIYSFSLTLKEIKTKKKKREIIKNVIKTIELIYQPDKIVVERTRLFSRGVISMKTIVALGSLIVVIVDATDLDVYSVDSRSFKAKVVGHANCSKQDVINWVKFIFKIDVNEDEADAVAIALYPFIKNPLLRRENN